MHEPKYIINNTLDKFGNIRIHVVSGCPGSVKFPQKICMKKNISVETLLFRQVTLYIISKGRFKKILFVSSQMIPSILSCLDKSAI